MNKQNYTIACVREVDQDRYGSECVDVFEIKQNGVSMFTLTFNYALDEKQSADAKVECIADIDPCMLPGIRNGIHLVAVVFNWLLRQQAERNTESFGDMFYDEMGRIDLPIDFYTLGGIDQSA